MARGVYISEPDLKEITLSHDYGGFSLEFYRGEIYYRTGAHAGEFAKPDREEAAISIGAWGSD